jgi:Flp pilus assembly protein TadG
MKSKLKQGVRKARKAERGATLVEYAFVLILFLTLLFGISGFGHAIFVYHHLNNAAKEATRYAAVRGYNCDKTETVSSCQSINSASSISGPTNTADVTAYVNSITPQSIDTSQLTITVCGVASSSACSASAPQICTTAVSGQGPYINYPGCTVSVTVQYPYTFIFPFIRTGSINLSSTSEMVIIH